MHQAKSVPWIISGPCHNIFSGVAAQIPQRAQWTVFQLKYTSQRLSKPHRTEPWKAFNSVQTAQGQLLLSPVLTAVLPTPTTPRESESHLLFVQTQICPGMSHPNTHLLHVCQSSQTAHTIMVESLAVIYLWFQNDPKNSDGKCQALPGLLMWELSSQQKESYCKKHCLVCSSECQHNVEGRKSGAAHKNLGWEEGCQ